MAGVLVYNYNNHITMSGSTASAAPVELRIPRMHVDAPVLNVGTTASGQMDAPVSNAVNSPYWTSVFWYDLGAAPGQAGNAVIAGHVDRVGGDPAVFWSLSSLQRGDSIFVTDGNNSTLKFVVDRVVNYPATTPGQEALQAVFGPTTAHHLNLITCSGAWTAHGYDQRLVVFSTQVNA
jgi:hypothetical protein